MKKLLLAIVLIVGCYQSPMTQTLERVNSDDSIDYVYDIGMKLEEFKKVNMNPDIQYKYHGWTRKFSDSLSTIYARNPLKMAYRGVEVDFVVFEYGILVQIVRNEFGTQIPTDYRPKYSRQASEEQ